MRWGVGVGSAAMINPEQMEREMQQNNEAQVWLAQPAVRDLGAWFEQQWAQNQFIAMAGVYNPLSALLAQQAGFKALYLSGGALTASLGLPDVGRSEERR